MKHALRFAALGAMLLSLSGCAAAVVSGATTAGVTIAQERSVGHAVDDAGIVVTIKHLFLKSNRQELLTHVGVEVVEGRVLLTGSVKDPESAVEAVKLSWRAEGVKEVINEIEITDKSGLKDFATDTWITAQIKSRLLVTKYIRSINYAVETVNGHVYLFGIAQDTEELNRVIDIARTTQYVQHVTSHVRLKTDPRRNQE